MSALSLHDTRFQAMGTQCLLRLYAPDLAAADSAVRAAITEVQRIEARYSRYRADSDLFLINQTAAEGGTIELDEETSAILDFALAAHHRSAGLFDVTSGILRRAWDFRTARLPTQGEIDALLPFVGLNKVRWNNPRLTFPTPGMELDLGGLAKEYAADRAAAECLNAGISHGLIDLGGDIRVLGPHPDNSPWQVGIRHPRDPSALLATAKISHGALATSGDYERCITEGGRRYGHILHPRTGWPVSGLSSVSVIAGDCLLAGTLSTIAMLKGDSGPAWLDSAGLPHLWMDERGETNRPQGHHADGFTLTLAPDSLPSNNRATCPSPTPPPPPAPPSTPSPRARPSSNPSTNSPSPVSPAWSR